MTQFLSIFGLSIAAGLILGAPVGVAGALIADAALTHNRRRLELILVAAIAGETILAYTTSFAADAIRQFLLDNESIFHLVSGAVIILISIGLFIATWHSTRGVVDREHMSGSSKWLIGHMAAPGAAFICNLVHPGSIFAFLFTVALFSSWFAEFRTYNLTFAGGILLGSGTVFGLCGVLFWKLRKKADRFVHHFRYGLAVIVGLFGIFLMLREWLT